MKRTIIPLSLFLALCFSAKISTAQLSVGLSVHIAPPGIPVYEQPPCPVDGYIWIPGYWAYGAAGYYWVPGYWENPPQPGFLWTPGYWGYAGGLYGWHSGYWGPHIGFYGGVNYGCGYFGSGYSGGQWVGGHFRYNTAYTRVNTTVIHNTYINRTVINNVHGNNRVSYNGGPGGINARPSAGEQVAMRDHHVGVTSGQTSHQQAASHDRNQFASVNHGRPSNGMMARPGGGESHGTVNHPPAPNRGNPQMNRPTPTMSHSQTMNHPQPQPHPTARGGGAPPHGGGAPHGGGVPHGGGGGGSHGGGGGRHGH